MRGAFVWSAPVGFGWSLAKADTACEVGDPIEITHSGGHLGRQLSSDAGLIHPTIRIHRLLIDKPHV